MNKKNYVAVATLAFAMLTSCAGQKEAKSTSGIDLANMDTTVSAGTDFFRYACGGWNDAHPLTAEYSRYGTFDELFEILTLVKTGKKQDIPIVLVGKEFWNTVVNIPGLASYGVISPEEAQSCEIVDTPEEAWAIIAKFYHIK